MSELPRTLNDWLDYQMRVHPNAIELGLDRVREVWRRLGAPAPAPVVITVGGTNGKGSTVAFLEAMLEAGGQRVGAFTSPHLLRYNERVRVAGHDADDETLVAAFARIEEARGDIPLTYFEYGTLAALWIFAHGHLDVAVLEVGLGGRLDAVNLIDAHAAVVTTIDLDHQDWLGDDRDSIGREKAGIFRSGRPAIVGDPESPDGLLAEARRIGADLRIAGRDFAFERDVSGWRWRSGDTVIVLPMPQLAAPCQLANASAAIAVLHALRPQVEWNPQAIARGVAQARVGARLQRFAGTPEIVVDVAHNPQAARALAEWLRVEPAPGRTLAVFGALGDKDVHGVAAALAGSIDAWFLAGLEHDSPRGLAAADLRSAIGDAFHAETPWSAHADVAKALAQACAEARAGDRVLAFGSFFVAAPALRFAASRIARRVG
ncbi:bifunctional tetrahydrofolate synthase/dihydrofolate synthase [Dokdonella sp.]|uniref:bifunctional tetrahydrofolate synthase/dihydrofolate synthase n=1 Tax=Dokdonella sp. TaxID=2291710 RepID=UPI00263A3B7C|nr:bifunctional tetrahydrofolate synthase/dihydrofolate synthase [Dokdonella sp.]